MQELYGGSAQDPGRHSKCALTTASTPTLAGVASRRRLGRVMRNVRTHTSHMRLATAIAFVAFSSFSVADDGGSLTASTSEGKAIEFYFENGSIVIDKPVKSGIRRVYLVDIQKYSPQKYRYAPEQQCSFEHFLPNRGSRATFKSKFSCPSQSPSELRGATYTGSQFRKGYLVMRCIAGCPPNPYTRLRWLPDPGEQEE